MKHNTFEPCKDHENGHFGWCLLCEIEQLRKENRVLRGRLEYIITYDDTRSSLWLLDTIKKIESGNG